MYLISRNRSQGPEVGTSEKDAKGTVKVCTQRGVMTPTTYNFLVQTRERSLNCIKFLFQYCKVQRLKLKLAPGLKGAVQICPKKTFSVFPLVISGNACQRLTWCLKMEAQKQLFEAHWIQWKDSWDKINTKCTQFNSTGEFIPDS